MTLSLVIPVWNDPEGLCRLLVQVQGMACFHEILISDDASDPPCGPQMPGLPAAVAADPRLIWLRSDSQRGAGHARNIALDRVQGSHVLFFDSDDLFTAEITDLVQHLDRLPPDLRDYDFCLFRHVDSRVRAAGGYGPLAGDERYWDAARATEAPAPLGIAAATQMCRIAAYPWNKIYRTAFLRDNGIRCTEIPVHNDVELHWMSFFKARRMLISSLICCEHFVVDAGQRLTNRSGRERFEVFRALEALQHELLRNRHLPDYAEPFIEFYTRLFGWITDTLEPDLRAAFTARSRQFLLDHLPEPLFTLIALRRPDVAARITRLLTERPA